MRVVNPKIFQGDRLYPDHIRQETHTVVAKVPSADLKLIATRNTHNGGQFRFRVLNGEFTNGEFHKPSTSGNLRELVVKLYGQYDDAEVQAFTTWKEAFQWLIDN